MFMYDCEGAEVRAGDRVTIISVTKEENLHLIGTTITIVKIDDLFGRRVGVTGLPNDDGLFFSTFIVHSKSIRKERTDTQLMSFSQLMSSFKSKENHIEKTIHS